MLRLSSSSSMEYMDYTALCSAVTLQSDKNGFFQEIVNIVRKSVDELWLNEFGRLKSNTERVRMCLVHKEVMQHAFDRNSEIFNNNTVRQKTSSVL